MNDHNPLMKSHAGGSVGRVGKPSSRSEIASFMVMDVMTAAAAAEAAGRHVIHMEVGQPASPAPATAREAARAAISDETLGYTLALGVPQLRDRIARHYQDTYGVSLEAERVVVTSGSSAAFVLAFLSVFEAGESVALPSPGYPCYRHILTALGQGQEIIETGPDTRWMPTIDQIDAVASRVAGILLASPNNPTGTMLEPERLTEIADVCRRRDLWFISDEIYHGLTYDRPAMTALSVSDDVIVINSFSKYFSMTGWRVGWMVVPAGLVATVERLAQNFYICPPAIAQVAALAAFDGRDELEHNRSIYAANRELLLAELPKVGFDKLVPADGAFYIYVDVSDYTNDSLAFSRQLLDETGIAATSGIDFDADRGHRFMRFSYAGATEDMREAIRRLANWPATQGRAE